ncbi:unnamed protein product [Angiostrongylus costaricensis]|uniref:Reverse transcriptase domain-containing protein n=1 Tax=Angiostrongylus costaricensis TaxID=334426 RepID=A0A0R3PK08_ANGCS|nr:unnamed protein product [Angiostrongylus costaricensis]
MRTLEWDNMGVKIDGRQLQYLRFADDIVLIIPNVSQAERILGDFDKTCGKIGLRLNLKKTMFVGNRLLSYATFTLNGTNISECSSCVYLAWQNQHGERLISSVAQKETSSSRSYHKYRGSSERKQDKKSLSVIERAVERMALGVCHVTQGKGSEASDLRQRPKIKDAALHAKQSNIRWAGHVMRMNDNRWTRAVSD